jgi:Uncharacterized conserved protein, contains double-stranded beta-helix domain
MNVFAAVANAIANGAPVISHEDAQTYEVGNLIVKVMVLHQGASVLKHIHPYTHAHILGKGRIRLDIDDEWAVYQAPCVITIQSGKYHGITALEDSVGFCVHDRTQLGV